MARSELGPLELTIGRLLNSKLRSVIPPITLSPLQISVIYLVLGIAGLVISDVYLPIAIEQPDTLAQIQAVKVGVEVILTAGLILFLAHRTQQAVALKNNRLESLQAERSILYRVFRHNFRNDMNVILGLCQQLKSTTQSQADIDQLETIISRTNQIGQYQQSLKQIEQILETPVAIQILDLEGSSRDK